MLRSRKSHQTYIKYQKSLAPQACDFCDLTDGVILDKNASVVVIRNIFPYDQWDFGNVTEHLLVIPNRHIASLSELSAAEKVDYLDFLGKYEDAGYNIYARTDQNKVAKSVVHQHTHLIKTMGPRRKALFYLDKPYILWHR